MSRAIGDSGPGGFGVVAVVGESVAAATEMVAVIVRAEVATGPVGDAEALGAAVGDVAGG